MSNGLSGFENKPVEERGTATDRLNGARRAWRYAARIDPLFGVKLLDRVLNQARIVFRASLFESLSEGCIKVGHWALVGSAGLGLIFSLIVSIRVSAFYLLWGVGLVLLLAVLQYAAEKFMDSGNSLVQSSPSHLGSATFLNCVALLSELIAAMCFVYLLILAARHGVWILFWRGLAIWALGTVVAFVALHPSLVNITVSPDVRAGEEAIGILSFFAKAAVRIVPVVFGVGTVLGTIGLLLGMVSLLAYRQHEDGRRAAHFVVSVAFLPIASYVAFVLYNLVIDVLRAILVLPGKLDRLGSSRER